jgi:hypothetical protein
MKFHTGFEQYSQEWKQLRCGKPTASQFYLLIDAEGKAKPPSNKERRRYLYRLAAERLLGEPMPDRFEGNEWTERGQNLEEDAAEAFRVAMKLERLNSGGFMTDDNDRYGCSPDRIIPGKREAVEIKSPAAWNHLQYLCEGPGDRYKQQVQGQLMIGEMEAVHFWSYHPNFPPVHIITPPDERFIGLLRHQLDMFCDELEATVRYVHRIGNAWEKEPWRKSADRNYSHARPRKSI